MNSIKISLKNHQLKNTPARKAILELLSESKTALNAYKIGESLNESFDTATIYRNLEKLEQHGLIHQVTSQRGYIACKLDQENHHHIFLVCTKCEEVREIPETNSSCQAKHLPDMNIDFTPQKHINEIIGLCKKCH